MARPQTDNERAKDSLKSKLKNSSYKQFDTEAAIKCMGDLRDADDIRSLINYIRQCNSLSEMFSGRMSPNPVSQDGCQVSLALF